jgi:hypothetical protein
MRDVPSFGFNDLAEKIPSVLTRRRQAPPALALAFASLSIEKHPYLSKERESVQERVQPNLLLDVSNKSRNRHDGAAAGLAALGRNSDAPAPAIIWIGITGDEAFAIEAPERAGHRRFRHLHSPR